MHQMKKRRQVLVTMDTEILSNRPIQALTESCSNLHLFRLQSERFDNDDYFELLINNKLTLIINTELIFKQ